MTRTPTARAWNCFSLVVESLLNAPSGIVDLRLLQQFPEYPAKGYSAFSRIQFMKISPARSRRRDFSILALS